MIIEEGLSIKTTSLCQMYCKHCTVIPWMQQHPDYHVSIEDIKNLIKYSKESNYKWKFILLSGGEPLLWENLEEGTVLLYKSGITDNLTMFTNAMAVNEKNIGRIGIVIDNLHNFRISAYKSNRKKIDYVVKKFGNRVNVVEREVRAIAPTEPIKNSLPADCHCRAYSLVDGYIDACGPARTILCKIEGMFLGDDVKSVKLQKNFLDFYKEYPKYNRKICQYCISNSKVEKHLKKEKA
jgi:hypothetical protein